MNKYYTPNIEEFFLGFKYQQKNEDLKDTWSLFTVGGPQHQECPLTDIIKDLEWNLNKDNIRVQYLNRDDVENLGWIKNKWIWASSYWLGDYILFMTRNNIIIRHYSIDDSGDYEFPVIFVGVINNKSELQI